MDEESSLDAKPPSLGLRYRGSGDVVALIDRALSEDPTSRPTLGELRYGLQGAAGIDPEAPREGDDLQRLLDNCMNAVRDCRTNPTVPLP